MDKYKLIPCLPLLYILVMTIMKSCDCVKFGTTTSDFFGYTSWSCSYHLVSGIQLIGHTGVYRLFLVNIAESDIYGTVYIEGYNDIHLMKCFESRQTLVKPLIIQTNWSVQLIEFHLVLIVHVCIVCKIRSISVSTEMSMIYDNLLINNIIPSKLMQTILNN
jgi:hypothetical protein